MSGAGEHEWSESRGESSDAGGWSAAAAGNGMPPEPARGLSQPRPLRDGVSDNG